MVPIYRAPFWTFMRVQYLDLGLKVLILQEGPHRSLNDHIGTMVMFYIMQNKVLKGSQGTTHSMVPIRDQDLDPESRVQNVVPE